MYTVNVSEILTDAGKTVEAVGRMLKRKKYHTDVAELRHLQASLRLAADGLDHIIEVIKIEHP